VRIFTLTFLLLFTLVLLAEEKEKKSEANSVHFIQPEFFIGKTLHAHSDFPETNYQTIYAVNFGAFVFNPDKLWSVFYNYPSVGVTLSKTSFGNDRVLGNAYTLMPFLDLNFSKKLKNSIHLKLGLGASYFTNHYDKVENPNNKAIGSTFTWTFQSTLNYTFFIRKFFSFQLGAGFIHHSNGHTQLPNLGLNSLVASLSSTFYLGRLNDQQIENFYKPEISKTRQYFLEFRSGIGMHELGDENTALERIKKAVYSFSASGGIIINQILKVSTGLTYRFYNHYYNYITTFNPPQYIDNPVLNSSNFFIYAGFEVLLGHVGLEAAIGLNLYKPFYKEQSQRFEKDSQTSYVLKKVIASRLGVRLYALNTLKNPRNNFYIAVNINANMGQADFSELSFGVVHRFRKIHSRD